MSKTKGITQKKHPVQAPMDTATPGFSIEILAWGGTRPPPLGGDTWGGTKVRWGGIGA